VAAFLAQTPCSLLVGDHQDALGFDRDSRAAKLRHRTTPTLFARHSVEVWVFGQRICMRTISELRSLGKQMCYELS
jgi:hypothetical protein